MESKEKAKEGAALHYSRSAQPAKAEPEEKELTPEQKAARKEAVRVANLPPVGQADLEKAAQQETVKLREQKAKEAEKEDA